MHDRLEQNASAGAYNVIFGATDNRIELKQGCREKEPLILKVRVGKGPRKFFNSLINDKQEPLLKKDWTGDFETVTTIYVVAVNNHDYKGV